MGRDRKRLSHATNKSKRGSWSENKFPLLAGSTRQERRQEELREIQWLGTERRRSQVHNHRRQIKRQRSHTRLKHLLDVFSINNLIKGGGGSARKGENEPCIGRERANAKKTLKVKRKKCQKIFVTSRLSEGCITARQGEGVKRGRIGPRETRRCKVRKV